MQKSYLIAIYLNNSYKTLLEMYKDHNLFKNKKYIKKGEYKFFKVKYRYQLILSLKANKCYKKLLFYLFYYINLLIIKFF